MIDITTIRASYQGQQKFQDYDILREYLQYKILDYMFSVPVSQKLCFLGGTALRIVYRNQRFSEDLDFDNIGNLSHSEFEHITAFIKQWLEHEGFEIELKHIYKWAYHCHIKIPKVLYANNLTWVPTEKIVIKIDIVAQNYQYLPRKVTIADFDVVSTIPVVSKELLLAQKIFTIFQRKRTKGRDFFDIMFLLGMTKQPDRWFLQQKLQINTPDQLKKHLIDFCSWINFEHLQKDVSPFLFNPHDHKVSLFLEYLHGITFIK